jgi:hypothetical protein
MRPNPSSLTGPAELDSLGLPLVDGDVNVVAHEVELVVAVIVGGMAASSSTWDSPGHLHAARTLNANPIAPHLRRRLWLCRGAFSVFPDVARMRSSDR